MNAGRDRCMNIDMDMVAEEIYADGSDIPKKVVQRGLIPCKNLFREVLCLQKIG
jgi:hypothetical protein